MQVAPSGNQCNRRYLVTKFGANRAREKQSEPEMVIAALRARAAALQASKKYEQAGRALEQGNLVNMRMLWQA